MPTPQVTTSLAQISQYLFGCQIAQDNAFRGGSLDNGRDLVLLIESDILQYGIDNNLNNVLGVSGDVYRLCGAKLQEANNILVSGSGGIVVPPSGSGNAGLTPFPINVTISSGEAGVSILQSSAWIGLQDVNSVVINQSILQKDVQFTFNSITGAFNFSLYGYILQTNDQVSSFGFMPV